MEYVEEEQYLLLDFKEKVEQKFFTKPNLFFKMVNLDTRVPLVQIGDHVFKGKYEDAIGTNLFFEEQDNLRPKSFYEKTTAINLEYVAKSAKVLNLQWQKVPSEILDVDSNELSHLEFYDNYETVLGKIEEGSLDIFSLIKKGDATKPIVKRRKVETIEKETIVGEKIEPSPVVPSKENEPIVLIKELDHKELLKNMFLKKAQPPEYHLNFDMSFSCDRDFAILKELYLKSLDYNKLAVQVDESNLSDLVDINASISDQIISNKDVHKLTEQDKQALFSMKNFDNLSVPMKLALLVEHLKEEKKFMATLSADELKIMDEFGRTAKDRYRLLKSFAKDLEYFLFLKMRESKETEVVF